MAAFTATALQSMLAVADVRMAYKDALAWQRAEEELIKEQPRLRRRRIRKELATWRDPETDRSLAYVDIVLLSWTLLLGASVAALITSLS